MKKIFISYSWEHDTDNALKLYEVLTQFPEHFDVWLDKKRLDPGLEWKPAIIKEIRDSDYFIAVLSSGSVSIKRGTMIYEIHEALDVLKEFAPTQVYIIPARVEQCMPAFPQLSRLNFVDLFPDWNSGMLKLIQSMDNTILPEQKGSGKTNDPVTTIFTKVPLLKDQVSLKEIWSTNDLQLRDETAKYTAFKRDSVTKGIEKKQKSKYHYKIGLVDLDIGLNNLEQITNQLNKAQNYFLFTLPKMAPLQRKVQKIDGVKNFNVSKVGPSYIKANKNIDSDFIVNMTIHPLAYEEKSKVFSDYFAMPSDHDERFLFVSADQLDKFSVAAGTKLEEALVYILIGQLVCYFTTLEYHKTTRGCVMDFCYDRRNVIKGLKSRSFCPSCEKKFPEGDFKNAINRLLKWKFK